MPQSPHPSNQGPCLFGLQFGLRRPIPSRFALSFPATTARLASASLSPLFPPTIYPHASSRFPPTLPLYPPPASLWFPLSPGPVTLLPQTPRHWPSAPTPVRSVPGDASVVRPSRNGGQWERGSKEGPRKKGPCLRERSREEGARSRPL